MIQDILAELRLARYRVAGVVQGVIVAERPIPGMPHHFRVCSAWCNARGWFARVKVTKPDPARTIGRVEEQVQEGGPFADSLAFACWLGGASSVPAGDGERAALERNTHQATRIA